MPLFSDDTATRSFLPLEEIPVSFGDVMGAQHRATLSELPVVAGKRLTELMIARGQGERMTQADALARIEQAGLTGHLQVGETGITDAALEILIERKQEELKIQQTLGRGRGGFGEGAARLGVALGTSLLDPVNVGLAFVPVVGEARYTRLLAGASGPLGRAGVRAGAGAIEGAAGAAIIEPLIYTAKQQEQADYDMADSLMNIAFGTIFGGGLHVVGGAGADVLRAMRRQVDTSPLANDPHIATLDEPNQVVLREMYARAEGAKPSFDEAVTGIAEMVGGRAVLAPLKGTKRATEKIAADYGGDASQIKDLLRATVEIDDAAQATRAIAQIQQRFDVLPTGQRNLFDPEVIPVDGYRDAKFNVRLADGTIAEVQVNLPQMLAAKNQAHALYEEREALTRSIGTRDRTPEEEARIEELNAKMRAIYTPAWEAAVGKSSLNRLGETAAPLRYSESSGNLRGSDPSSARVETDPSGLTTSTTGTPSQSQNRLTSTESPPGGIVSRPGEAPSALNISAADRAAMASPQVREAALRTAVGQMADGKPVNVEPLFAGDPRAVAQAAARAAEAPDGQAIRQAEISKAVDEEIAQSKMALEAAEEEAALAEAMVKEHGKVFGYEAANDPTIEAAQALTKRAERWSRAAEIATACLIRGA